MAQARAFLSGKSRDIQAEMAKQMQAAAEMLDFETAARYRDRIRALTATQAHQDINIEGIDDADVIACHQDGGSTCIQVFFFRGGSNYGNRAYFPSHDKNLELPEVLGAFISQFYDNKPSPHLILVSHEPAEQELIAEALSLRAGHRVELGGQSAAKRAPARPCPGQREGGAGPPPVRKRVAGPPAGGRREVFGLDSTPERIEVYDNSHIQGTNAIGAMIVAGPDGLMKNSYRKFNIRSDIAPGDDYGMMREVLTRRFSRAIKEDPDRERGTWPDLVLIDGGQGQLSAVMEVMNELDITNLAVVSIAKGPDRNAGRERFFMPKSRLSLWTRRTPSCISSSVCATRPTASPSGPTGRGAPRRSGSR